ncbi:hypothetical protein SMGD1_1431 [Sulfurimonas gotlandica GD1]|uniref:Uncharacterized protein n=1 Tax=Sulfurimonas gotlandica (strain DSM 19862 / JCM 16533 / GD1) TaxID=929558 RepID=B6BHF9_SULGG|nr:hypothetical protein [Sulfurimonas gotlandica]EDZ63864.1 hypothetical protein CBGD1_1484 [Sulfurimonas gotlandica GD1]EHP29955.1 hypothetical protein SMGD1_1431 [Sulfurimonas gotlandica GD1]
MKKVCSILIFAILPIVVFADTSKNSNKIDSVGRYQIVEITTPVNKNYHRAWVVDTTTGEVKVCERSATSSGNLTSISCSKFY